ncbi:MAG: hypothetical protein IJJ33_02330 [Victivallales bacterium]|nr:hypothetical protein [Victivallales bacterium]
MRSLICPFLLRESGWQTALQAACVIQQPRDNIGNRTRGHPLTHQVCLRTRRFSSSHRLWKKRYAWLRLAASPTIALCAKVGRHGWLHPRASDALE